MEEIFSSPYNTSQIEPVDLGLGKPGTLGKLTEGIYEIPKYEERKSDSPDVNVKKSALPNVSYYDPPRRYAKSSYVAKLDPEKAEEFLRRNSEHVERTNSEIEKMKAKHAKKMARFKAGGIISAGEKKLRRAVTDPDDVGPEFWRIEGRIDPDDEPTGPDGQTSNDEQNRHESKLRVADIVAQVEASLGRTAAVVLEVKRIQDGGLEERQEKPVASISQPTTSMNGPQFMRESRNGSQGSGVLVGDTDMGMDDPMGGSQAAGLLDQFHTGETGSASAFSTHSTPAQSFSTPQAMMHQHSAVGTPSALGHVSASSPQQGGVHSQGRTPQPSSGMQHSFSGGDGMDLDTEMHDAAQQGQMPEGGSGAGTEDWIVVPPGGVSPSHNTQQQIRNENHTAQPRAQPSLTQSAQIQPNISTAQNSMNQGNQNSANISGGVDTSGFEFSTGDDMTSGFGNLGGGEEGGGDLDLGMDLGMDDSAFGDAFHGVEGARDADDNE